MPDEHHKLFNVQASDYAKFRPTYPKELYDIVYEYLGRDHPRCLAVDVATGNGQAACALAECFDKVIGLDVSEQQISQAQSCSNIEYRVATAEETGLPDHSADLLTVATALHWFEFDPFFMETHRILKPGATFAAWQYFLPEVQGNEAATQLIYEIYKSPKYLWNLLTPRTQYVANGYADIHPTAEYFEDEQRKHFYFTTESSIEQLTGWVSTWSAFHLYSKANPDRPDLRNEVSEQLMKALNTDDGSFPITLNWIGNVLLARAR